MHQSRRLRVALLVVSVAAGPAAAGAQGSDTGLPLTPTRTIRFTTAEGTWVSLDVSPDGKTIVFDLLGHLYLLPIAGGKATRITSGMPFDAQPRFSPDGSQIAFTSDRDGWVNIWIADRAGQHARQITRYRWGGSEMVCSPAWAPDGRSLVVSERLTGPARNGRRLVEYDVESGAATPLTHLSTGDRASYLGPALSRDGRFLYAAVNTQPAFEVNAWQVTRIDRSTRRAIGVTSPVSGVAAMRPIVSPDGRYLVFSAPTGDATGLRIRDLRTDREWWLRRHAQRDVAAWGDRETRDLVPGSAFTPDGRALITAYDGKIWRIDLPNGDAHAIPFRADVERPIGPLGRFAYSVNDDSLTVHAVRNPQISPDGHRVAFSALDRVWVMDLPAGSPRRLTHDDRGEFFPAWSPDGRFIAYSTWTDAEGGAVFRARADGSGGGAGESAPERLTQERAFFEKTRYTPDGARLLAVRGSADVFRLSDDEFERPAGMDSLELVSLPPDGGSRSVVAPYPVPKGSWSIWKTQGFVYGQPHIGDHGDRVLMAHREEGLVALNADGKGRTVLAKVVRQTGGLAPDEMLLSPDGRGLLVTYAEGGPWLVTLSQPLGAGSSPVSITLGAAQAPGVGVYHLTDMGADFIGWTAAGAPYYSSGSSLYLGDGPPSGEAPRFRRIRIHLVVPRDRARGMLLLRGGRVLTMRGRRIIERGDVLVRDGRIAAVGPSGTLTVPAEARVMDVTGKTVLPGYLDVHDHVGYAVGFGEHLTHEPRLATDLAFGITTLRDPLGYGPDLMAVGEREAVGDLVSPRVFTMSFGIHSASWGDGSGQTLEQTREVLRQFSENYASETIKQYMSGDRRSRQLVAMAAQEQHLTATNEGGYMSAMDLTFAMDGYSAFEHPIPATPQYDDVVQLIVRAGVIQTPTLAVHFRFRNFVSREDVWNDPRMRRFLPPGAIESERRNIMDRPYLFPDNDAEVREVASSPARSMAAGGCVGMGSHGNVPGFDAHWELWYMVLGGMPPYDALRTATICSATSIGHTRDLGSIEPGKLADLQVLDKDPLSDIHNTLAIRYVVKGGRVYEAATLDEIWPRARPLAAPWWHTDRH